MYLDTYVYSFIDDPQDSTWRLIKEGLTRLAAGQFWIFPVSSARIRETYAIAPLDNRMRRFYQLQELGRGRVLTGGLELKARQLVRAFEARLAGAEVAHLHWSDAHNVDPGKVTLDRIPHWEGDCSHGIADATAQLLRDAQKSYLKVVNSEIKGNTLDAKNVRDIEIDVARSTFVEILQLVFQRDFGHEYRFLRSSSGQHMVRQIPPMILHLAQSVPKGMDAASALYEFIMSDDFISIPYTAIHIEAYALMYGRFRQSGRSDAGRNDMADLEDVASVLPYVDDIWVDKLFADLLKHTNFRGHMPEEHIWTARRVSEFAEEVRSALDSDEFARHEAFFSSISPYLSRVLNRAFPHVF